MNSSSSPTTEDLQVIEKQLGEYSLSMFVFIDVSFILLRTEFGNSDGLVL